MRVAIEFRQARWVDDEHREDTIAFLARQPDLRLVAQSRNLGIAPISANRPAFYRQARDRLTSTDWVSAATRVVLDEQRVHVEIALAESLPRSPCPIFLPYGRPGAR
jgi:hypothetical protein